MALTFNFSADYNKSNSLLRKKILLINASASMQVFIPSCDYPVSSLIFIREDISIITGSGLLNQSRRKKYCCVTDRKQKRWPPLTAEVNTATKHINTKQGPATLCPPPLLWASTPKSDRATRPFLKFNIRHCAY